MVPHTTIIGPKALAAYEEAQLDAGYEGVMLRDPAGLYKYGRSTAKEGLLMKVKRFADSEAVILGAVPLLRNGNVPTTNEMGRTKRSSHKAGKMETDLLGALRVREYGSGVMFEIGTGFTAVERAVLWRIHQEHKLEGRWVKFKSLRIGVKDRPRHPVFLGMRDRKDMDP